jgi:transcriptional regulator with GAF, ATPase, and Fis domain
LRRSEWSRRYPQITGESPKLFRVFHILDKVAASDSTVLVLGESGTGKELVAEAIHLNSARAQGPFVKLNCAALVESLLLSELFGHERGSFTGAHQRKVGRFEMAAGGTIFLDEIGDISPKTQVSLLRVLQEREFERVGGGRPIRLQARVVCATNRNLPQMVREGSFREDLYYRLKGLTVDLPPLRERVEDIPLLVQHFLARYALESATLERRISADALAMLSGYAWPGNVRELENIVRSVALFAEGPEIGRRDFDEYRELFEDAPAFARVASRPSSPPPATPSAAVSAPTSAAIAPSRASALLAHPPREAPPLREPLRATSGPGPQPRPRPEPQSLPQEPEHDPPATAALPPDLEDDASDAEAPARPPTPSEAALLAQLFQLGIPLGALKRRIQDEAIAQALRSTRGNITRAAELLGMKRPRLSQIINANEALKVLCQGVGR